MADKQDPLGAYRGKRDLTRTPEPSAGCQRRGGGRPRFVVHKHDATTLHDDFRLEAAGVLKSWAVPKGPSTNPKDKRLAMPTEDHPLDYADYEGVIPEVQCGAGPVIVWDAGTYQRIRPGVEIPETPRSSASSSCCPGPNRARCYLGLQLVIIQTVSML
jgi:DNA ligase D-like protein (predicted 3'-phosphoesterase)